MKDEELLREYIREAINLKSAKDFGSGLAGMLGDISIFGSGKKDGYFQKLFAGFMERQLDAAGENISKYLSSKLDKILPDDVKTAIYKSSSKDKKEDGGAYDSLAKLIQSWIESYEEISGEDFSSSEKKQIAEYAGDVYAASLKKNKDSKKALAVTKNALDMKYAPKLHPDKKDKKDKKSKA